MLVEPAEHWAAHALNTVGIAPPSSSRPHTVKAPRPQGAARLGTWDWSDRKLVANTALLAQRKQLGCSTTSQ